MEKEYYYTKCLRPRKVFNQYTNQSILVPCGHCQVCLQAKASANTIKCTCESACNEYLYFVTLTYNQESLPTASLVPIIEHYDEPDKNGYSFRRFLRHGYHVVSNMDGEVLGEYYPEDYLKVETLCKKVNISQDSDYRQIPILYKPDVQNFLKRLRKYLSNVTDERIRYFACGEYGPIHYRPHYHLLLWFQKEQTAENICAAVSNCWKFGRVDVSRSFGSSCSYVAKYVNGTCNLPKVFRLAQSQPFNTHSKHLGSKVFAFSVKTLEEINPTSVKSISVPFGRQYATFDMWRSVKSTLFPKCKGFSQKSKPQRCYSYKVYDIARKWTKQAKTIDIARYIASYIMNYGLRHPEQRITKLLNYFYDSVFYVFDEHTPCNYDKFVDSVYRELLTSRHFLSHICHNDINKVPYYVDKITEYYDMSDRENIKRQYKMFEKYGDDIDFTLYYPQYWSNDNDESLHLLMETEEYKQYSYKVSTDISNSVKHKELNDLNKIFNYL